MKLYGTLTSPFARRIRVIAEEVGEPVELHIAKPEDATSGLHEVSPIRKVPVGVFGDRTVYDSQRIADWMIQTRGWGTLAPPQEGWKEQNLVNALDEALLSIVQVFYLRRDNVTGIEGSPFEKRQFDRADAVFGWARGQLREDRFGIPEITAVCVLDWLDFRPQLNKYSSDRSGLERIRKAWGGRPSLAATTPRLQ